METKDGSSWARKKPAWMRVGNARRREWDVPGGKHFESIPISIPPLGKLGIPRDRNGIAQVEQNPALRPYRARGFGPDPGIYDEMLRTDGTVAGTLALISREISRANWDLWTPPNPTIAEGRAADLVSAYLGLDGRGGMLRGGLPRLLRFAVRSLAYGFFPFERTWANYSFRGGVAVAPGVVSSRAPRSVKGWIWDGDHLAGMVQQIYSRSDSSGAMDGGGGEGGGWGDWAGDLFGLRNDQRVIIPSSQLLLFSFDETEGNPEGLSVYRPAWIWWKTKRDVLSRYHIAADRLFGGVTILQRLMEKDGSPSISASMDDLDGFDEAFSLWMRNELGWLEAPTGWEIKQEYPGFDLKTPEGILRYCDDQIRAVFAAQLLAQGSAAENSMASASGQLLYNSIDAIASWMSEIINGQPGIEYTGLIRPLIDANIEHDDSFRYPRIYAKGLEHKDTKAWIDAVVKSMQFMGILYSPSIEIELRKALDMPALTDEELSARELFARLRMENLAIGVGLPGAGNPGERASEEGTQAPIQDPKQMPVDDPDGEDDAG